MGEIAWARVGMFLVKAAVGLFALGFVALVAIVVLLPPMGDLDGGPVNAFHTAAEEGDLKTVVDLAGEMDESDLDRALFLSVGGDPEVFVFLADLGAETGETKANLYWVLLADSERLDAAASEVTAWVELLAGAGYEACLPPHESLRPRIGGVVRQAVDADDDLRTAAEALGWLRAGRLLSDLTAACPGR